MKKARSLALPVYVLGQPITAYPRSLKEYEKCRLALFLARERRKVKRGKAYLLSQGFLPKLVEAVRARNNAVEDLVALAQKKGGVDRVGDGEVNRILRRHSGADFVTPGEQGTNTEAERQIVSSFKRAFAALEAEAESPASRETITALHEEFLKRLPKLIAGMPADPLPGAAGAFVRHVVGLALQQTQ